VSILSQTVFPATLVPWGGRRRKEKDAHASPAEPAAPTHIRSALLDIGYLKPQAFLLPACRAINDISSDFGTPDAQRTAQHPWPERDGSEEKGSAGSCFTTSVTRFYLFVLECPCPGCPGAPILAWVAAIKRAPRAISEGAGRRNCRTFGAEGELNLLNTREGCFALSLLRAPPPDWVSSQSRWHNPRRI